MSSNIEYITQNFRLSDKAAFFLTTLSQLGFKLLPEDPKEHETTYLITSPTYKLAFIWDNTLVTLTHIWLLDSEIGLIGKLNEAMNLDIEITENELINVIVCLDHIQFLQSEGSK